MSVVSSTGPISTAPALSGGAGEGSARTGPHQGEASPGLYLEGRRVGSWTQRHCGGDEGPPSGRQWGRDRQLSRPPVPLQMPIGAS